MPTALRTAEYHDRGEVIPLSRQLELVRIEPVKFHAMSCTIHSTNPSHLEPRHALIWHYMYTVQVYRIA